jgi:hypothetical protein
VTPFGSLLPITSASAGASPSPVPSFKGATAAQFYLDYTKSGGNRAAMTKQDTGRAKINSDWFRGMATQLEFDYLTKKDADEGKRRIMVEMLDRLIRGYFKLLFVAAGVNNTKGNKQPRCLGNPLLFTSLESMQVRLSALKTDVAVDRSKLMRYREAQSTTAPGASATGAGAAAEARASIGKRHGHASPNEATEATPIPSRASPPPKVPKATRD